MRCTAWWCHGEVWNWHFVGRLGCLAARGRKCSDRDLSPAFSAGRVAEWGREGTAGARKVHADKRNSPGGCMDACHHAGVSTIRTVGMVSCSLCSASFRSPSPCLTQVLDEPTNHLDIPSKETLEEALQAFQGELRASGIVGCDVVSCSRHVQLPRRAFRHLGSWSDSPPPCQPPPTVQQGVWWSSHTIATSSRR